MAGADQNHLLLCECLYLASELIFFSGRTLNLQHIVCSLQKYMG